MSCIVVVVGVYGQIHDSVIPPVSPYSNLHLGFGGLLLCTIGVRMRDEMRHFAVNPAADLRAATRHLARLVYLLMYALAGLRQLTNIGVYLWHGGTFDLGRIVVGNSGWGDHPTLLTMDSFQIYASYGIAAVFVIRMAR